MNEWEYLTIRGNENLLQLGNQGWELVAVAEKAEGEPLLYFKRPLESFRDRWTREQKQRYYAKLGLKTEKVER